jgi:hypothetical protein
MRTKDNIKVVAPANNPHICYIPKAYEQKIAYVKRHTGKSLYRLLCASAGYSLGTKEQIATFKKHLKTLGYKTIGEWAMDMLDIIYNTKDFKDIPQPTQKGE